MRLSDLASMPLLLLSRHGITSHVWESVWHFSVGSLLHERLVLWKFLFYFDEKDVCTS